jgi:hypothetical protein
MEEHVVKKIIDMAYATNIFGGNEAIAWEILEFFIDTLPQAGDELNSVYRVRQSDPVKFQFAIERFYDGVLYIGAPALREAVKDLLMALEKEEEGAISRLYENALDEMKVLEQKVSEMRIAG